MSDVWNAEYRRWHGESTGVWSRRLAIARYGLRLALAGRVIRFFLVLAFSQTLLLAGVFFVFSQFVAPESALLDWLEETGGEGVATLLKALTSWFLLYPEICVDGVYRTMFFLLSFSCPFLSVVIVALFVHRLIANDLASQAIVIYNSKALTGWDYLLGKFAIVATILSVVWLLPVIASWILGNLLSPDWSFFWHSFPSLLRGLTVGLVAVVSLSCLALLASSLARKSGAAVGFWALGWLVLGAISSAVARANQAFAYISPFEAISTFGEGVFRMRDFVMEARGVLPFFDGFFAKTTEFSDASQLPVSNGEILAPLLSLAACCALSILIVSRRVSEK